MKDTNLLDIITYGYLFRTRKGTNYLTQQVAYDQTGKKRGKKSKTISKVQGQSPKPVHLNQNVHCPWGNRESNTISMINSHPIPSPHR